MNVAILLAVFAIIVVAGFGQTIVGFGFSLLAVPLLGLVIDPKDAVAVSLVGLLINSGGLAWSERNHIDWPAARWLLIGAAPGLPVGLLILEAISPNGLRLALAVAIGTAVAMIISGFTIRSGNRTVELGAGFLTGALTTSLNTNGPPTVLALQARRLEPQQFRPTASAVLGLTSLVGAGLFAAAGRFTTDVTIAAAVAIPALGVGWLAGATVRQRVPARLFRRVVLGLLLVSAVMTVLAAIS